MGESSSWVLTLRWCQSSRLLGFWILGTWQSSLTLEDFLTLAGFFWSSCFLVLALGSLPDSWLSSGLLLVFRTLLVISTLKVFTYLLKSWDSFKGEHIVKQLYVYF